MCGDQTLGFETAVKGCEVSVVKLLGSVLETPVKGCDVSVLKLLGRVFLVLWNGF